MVRPAIVEDPFAGPAWSTSRTLLALEKLRVGEALDSDDRKHIGETRAFLISLCRRLPDFSREADLALRFWVEARSTLKLDNLIDELKSLAAPGYDSRPGALDPKISARILQMQDAILNVLIVINHCRQRRE